MIYLKQQNFPEWFYLSTIAIFNAIMLISSPFIGSQIDKGFLKKMLYVTALALGIFNICFYQLATMGWLLAILGLCAWGVQRASAQIVFSSFIFKSIEKKYYGTAIGIYYIVTGVASMLSAFSCGYLAKFNFVNVFLFSSFFAFLALGVSLHMFFKREKFATANMPASVV